MIHSFAVVLAQRRPFLTRPSMRLWRTSDRSHGSIKERGWRCRRSGGGIGLESENFTGGGAEIGEQRPELESERQKDWRGKDTVARIEAREKQLRL